MDFNLEYYRTFYYVAKFSSITKAAAALYLTQPAVSRSIQKLEKRLGCKMFQRTPRGMALTREGDALYSHVSAAFKELETGEQKVHKYAGYEIGELYVGVTETALYHFLMPKLIEFQKRFPNIHIHVTGFSTDDLWENLKTAALDVAILVSPLPEDMDCKLIHLRDFQDVFTAGPNFSELKERVLSPADIVRYPIVCLGKGTAARTHLDQWFEERGLALTPDYSVRTSTLVLPFVENNLAVGIIPYEFLKRGIKAGRLFHVRLSEDITPRQLYLAICEEYPMSAVCHEFVRSISK